MGATRLNSTLRRLFRAPVYLYCWSGGWLLGHRFLLLIHVGRRTGLRRQTRTGRSDAAAGGARNDNDAAIKRQESVSHGVILGFNARAGAS